jgi:hypothetical protein
LLLIHHRQRCSPIIKKSLTNQCQDLEMLRAGAKQRSESHFETVRSEGRSVSALTAGEPHMHTRDRWLTLQLEAFEARVKVERQRLHEVNQQQARHALIMLSLPELLGELSDKQDTPEHYPSCKPVAASMH